jgi:membrane protease YdiL (CAAX protease family)
VQEPLEGDRLRLGVTAAAVGFGGYALVILWGVLLVSVLGTPTGIVERQIMNGAALALATLLTARVYLAWSGLGRAFLDISWPDGRTIGWAILGLFALVGLSLTVGVLGIPTAEHGLTDQVRAAGVSSLWVLVPISLLVVGPAEELVYRNLVQKTLARGTGVTPAIIGASAIFAVAHFPAYASPDLQATVGSLVVVFALSCILGAIYARTRNLPAVALLHGAYDVVAFVDIFL